MELTKTFQAAWDFRKDDVSCSDGSLGEIFEAIKCQRTCARASVCMCVFPDIDECNEPMASEGY